MNLCPSHHVPFQIEEKRHRIKISIKGQALDRIMEFKSANRDSTQRAKARLRCDPAAPFAGISKIEIPRVEVKRSKVPKVILLESPPNVHSVQNPDFSL